MMEAFTCPVCGRRILPLGSAEEAYAKAVLREGRFFPREELVQSCMECVEWLFGRIEHRGIPPWAVPGWSVQDLKRTAGLR